MARLIHGAQFEGIRFTAKQVNVGLVSALMHDTGYIQTAGDLDGTGAKYTVVHIDRSIDFIKTYYRSNDYFGDEIDNFEKILNCTGLSTDVGELDFPSPEVELLGMMLGTADLLGQMGDRLYLEKLIFLYHEFAEANVEGFDSEFDLLRKTIGFYEMTKKRFISQLGGVNRFMINHFRERWSIDEDLYASTIEKNIGYLRQVLQEHEDDYLSQLKRGEIMAKLNKFKP
ncbi:MAG: hypothetical protein PHY31_04940, partial [Smithellaceae bacterium]|nr:hypothetical protein [Smithellaceae bacterium]